MNAGPLMSDWVRLLSLLGVEIVLVVGIVALFQRRTRSSLWQRTLWRLAWVGIVGVVALEFGGGAQALSQWLRPSDDSPPNDRVMQVRGNLEPSLLRPDRREPTDSPSPLRRPFSNDPAEVAAITWWPAWVWLFGTSILLARCFGRRIVFTILWRKRRLPADPLLVGRVESLARLAGIRRRVRVFVMHGLAGPVAFGVVRPAIAVPPNFAGVYEPARQDAMLAHELGHVAGLDALWLELSEVVVAFLWWHPLVWHARAQLRLATELAADDSSRMLEHGPEVLAECLVMLARRLTDRNGTGALGIQGGGFRSGLGRRVERLLGASVGLTPVRPGRRFVGITTFLVLFLLIAAGGSWVMDRAGGNRIAAGNESLAGSMTRLFWGQLIAAEPAADKPVKDDPRNAAAKPDLESMQSAPAQVAAPSEKPVPNTPMPQVVIETKFCELITEDWIALGLDWLGAGGQTNTPPQAGFPTNVVDQRTVVLTSSQLGAFVQALEQRAGINVLTAPRVTTLSGRQAQIKITEVRTIVTRVDALTNAAGVATEAVPIAETLEFGPTLDVVPQVLDDGLTIDLTMIAAVREFLGYDNGAQPKSPDVVDQDPFRAPRPISRERQLKSRARLWDGQTVVLYGGTDRFERLGEKKVPVLGDIPFISELFRTQHAEARNRKLLVLVTVTVIDAAGNRARLPAEIPDGVPPQP